MESDRQLINICSSVDNEMVKLIGSRGTMDILCLFCCTGAVFRFNQLNSALSHISTKTIAMRLRDLEENGILTRTAFNEIPPRVEYSMTEKGQKLIEALTPLVMWLSEYTDAEHKKECSCASIYTLK